MPDPLVAAKLIIETIVTHTIGLTPIARAKVIAYFYLPLLILGLVAYFGGGLSTDAGIVVSELRTEIAATGDQTGKRGLVVIAEPNSSEYRIPVTSNGARIWSSLDEHAARRNKEKVGINQAELRIDTPLNGEGNPVTLVVEGDVGTEMYMPGETVPVNKWGLSSRRSGSLVYGVLIICALALGLGVAVGSPPVKPEKDDTNQVGKEPSENGVVKRHAVDPQASKVRMRPRSKAKRKKIPRITQDGQ